MTDAEYLAWLQKDSQQRVILVEAKAYSSSTEVTRYLSTYPFISTPTDTPANTVYENLITNDITFTRRVADQLLGQATQSYGDIEIINLNGDLDDWLNDAWDGRSLKLYLGGPTWPKSDFRLILDGVTADITARDANTLTLKARDKSYLFEQPIQTNVIGGTTANADAGVPLTYGECYNVEPVLIDAALHKYQVHDGQIEAITTVYDNGLSTTFVADLATGTFTLSVSPAGRITADVKGAKPGGAYLNNVADIIKHIVTTRTDLTNSDLDLTNFTDFATDYPQVVGVYVQNGSSVAIKSVLTDLVGSVGGFYGLTRGGLLKLGQLAEPTGTATLSIGLDQINQRGVSIKNRSLPFSQYSLGYKKNFTVQSDGVAGAVAESRRAELANEYFTITKTDSSVLTTHLLAEKQELFGTALIAEADADAEADRRMDLFNVVRTIYQIEAKAAPYQVDLGDEVEITYNRFGFENGENGIVVGFVENISKNKLTLELWR